MTELLDIRVLLRMVRRTLTDPQGGARAILDLRLPVPVLWQFFLLQLVISAILKVIVFTFFPTPEVDLNPSAAISFTMIEAAMGAILALATYHIAALHGFTSMGRVFLGIVLSLMALAFVFNIVLALLGIRIG